MVQTITAKVEGPLDLNPQRNTGRGVLVVHALIDPDIGSRSTVFGQRYGTRLWSRECTVGEGSMGGPCVGLAQDRTGSTESCLPSLRREFPFDHPPSHALPFSILHTLAPLVRDESCRN